GLRSSREPAGTTTATIVTSASETDPEDDADDEGSFFDLELALPEEDGETEGIHEVSDDAEDPSGGEGDEERTGGDSDGTDGGGDEIKLMFSSCSSGEGRATDQDLAFSPSDDLVFKGRLVAVDPPASTAAAEHNTSAKAPAAQLSASLLKSATRFRVFMQGLKKSKASHAKPEKSEANPGSGDGGKQKSPPPSPSPPPQQKNTLTVKLKLEEVPIISLFTRDNSSRHSSSSTSSSSSSSSSKKQNGNESVVSDEKRFVTMNKYLKKVKPLYIRVSRRYGEKLRLSGHLSFGSGAPAKATEAPAKSRKQTGSININIPAGLKVVKKHLGKSRSSSSASPPSVTATAAATATAEKSGRRDDSLQQQQDGIQSAILHCKRSLKSSRDGESPGLPRSASK
ncbi:PREDICTED: probable membrane-associated kinase regulator 2, partial [Tarenaya hassleriana]|uniref:probable membrane-associated kinase regulator 2 n=1 Tax=Tarenaya hassleriana TaxID=28532 RepID=UPI00053C3256